MDESQSDQAQAQETGGWSFFRILWIAVVVIVLYVLSLEPMARLYGNRNPPAAVRAFYKPLELLYNHSTLAKRAFDWYLRKVWNAH